MLRCQTEPGATRRHSYDEAIRRPLLDLDAANARALLRRDTNREAVYKLRVILTSGLACSLLTQAEQRKLR